MLSCRKNIKPFSYIPEKDYIQSLTAGRSCIRLQEVFASMRTRRLGVVQPKKFGAVAMKEAQSLSDGFASPTPPLLEVVRILQQRPTVVLRFTNTIR